MKKIVISLISVLFLFCGCEINRMGADIHTEYVKAHYEDWHRHGRVGDAGFYIYQEFGIKEITNRVVDDGAVLVYFIDENGRDNMLPYVYPVDNGRTNVNQNIRFIVEKGVLTIAIEWDDSQEYEIDYDMRFKVCVLDPAD